ncbi:MAG TPA: lipocalin family protein [Desulfotignum sp.]|nr:lipocalin family protein [Desulfotignum sp.]
MQIRSLTRSLVFSLFLTGCAGIPENITPVDNFSLERYLGTWYEIARLDHSFERGLTHVTADYSLRDDGAVRVLNRGYSAGSDVWKQAEGKAYFVKGPDYGHLKVSFFGPFYGSYIVFELDRDNYQYALVCGPSRSYLWLLARTPVLEENIKRSLIEKAEAAGFETSKLIYVDHGRSLN